MRSPTHVWVILTSTFKSSSVPEVATLPVSLTPVLLLSGIEAEGVKHTFSAVVKENTDVCSFPHELIAVTLQ